MSSFRKDYLPLDQRGDNGKCASAGPVTYPVISSPDTGKPACGEASYRAVALAVNDERVAASTIAPARSLAMQP